MLVRRIARPLLAATFLQQAVETLRNPPARTPAAEAVVPTPALQQIGISDVEQAVKINAGVQVGAGLLLTLGRLPRLAALALAASLVPTTAAAHRFWEADPARRGDQQLHFLKNVSLLGGLLIAAVDTEGRESLSRKTRRVSRTAGRRASRRAGVVAAHQREHLERLRETLPVG